MPKADVVIVEGNDLPYHFFYGQVPEHVLTAIDQELSFYPANYERTTAFQKDEWDGRIQLFQQTRSGKSWYYPAGLKKRVAKVLKIFGIKYAVKRAEKREYLPIEVEWKSDFVLRDYQNEAVAAILEANGGIVSLPTGAGKTIIALKIIQAMDIPVLILVHTKELLAQWKKEIKTHFGIDCGIVGDGMRKWEPITVAMTQTLASMVRKGDIKTLEYGLLVCDECHRAPADSTYSVAMRCTARARAGLSVSPDTMIPVRLSSGEIRYLPIVEVSKLWDGGDREMETLYSDENGRVSWGRIENVWGMNLGSKQMYRVSGAYSTQVRVTEDHSIMVFDSEKIAIVEKAPTEITSSDYLIRLCGQEVIGEDVMIDLLEYADPNHYVYVKDHVSFDPIYERSLGNPKVRYVWKNARCLPVWAAREIGLTGRDLKSIVAHKHAGAVTPLVRGSDLATFLGLFNADGCLDEGTTGRGRRVSFYTSDDAGEISRFVDIISKLTDNVKVTKRGDKSHVNTKGRTIKVDSVALVRILAAMGCSSGLNKRTPQVVISNPALYRDYINGYVLGDGSLSNRGNRGTIYISTSNPRMVDELSFMLTSIGYSPGCYTRIAGGGLPHMTGEYTSYMVYFTPTTRKHGPTNDIVPKDWEPCIPMVGELKRIRMSVRMCDPDYRLQTLLKSKFQKVIDATGRTDLQWLVDANVSFIKCTSVEPIPADHDMVYDISVRGGTFFGNTLLVHNSATPRRVDNKDLKIFAAVGEVTSNITPCDLVRRGYLAKPMLHLHHVPPDSQFFSYGWPKEYDVGIVANDDRNDMIVEDAMHYAANGLQIYVHVERIDHLKILYYRLQKVFEPGQVAYLCGKQPSDDRQEIIKRFKAGEIRVVVGTLLKEGADVPAISCLVNASGLKSDVALVQKVGRALRTADGKDSAIIVDFIDSGKFLRKHSEERYQTYMTTYGDCIDITEE